MSESRCPVCGSSLRYPDGWAASAVSVLVPAPALRDLATRIRCPRCGNVSSETERALGVSPARGTRVLLAIVLVVVPVALVELTRL